MIQFLTGKEGLEDLNCKGELEMSDRFVPESTTVIEYPRSKRKVVIDHHGNVISDTAKDKKE